MLDDATDSLSDIDDGWISLLEKATTEEDEAIDRFINGVRIVRFAPDLLPDTLRVLGATWSWENARGKQIDVKDKRELQRALLSEHMINQVLVAAFRADFERAPGGAQKLSAEDERIKREDAALDKMDAEVAYQKAAGDYDKSKDSDKSTFGFHWANDGYCTLEAENAVFESALMCTETTGVDLDTDRFPARGILIRLATPLDGFTRIELVFAKDRIATMKLLGDEERSLAMYSLTGGTVSLLSSEMNNLPARVVSRLTSLVQSRATTLEEEHRVKDVGSASKRDFRVAVLARRLVTGLIIAYQSHRHLSRTGLALSRAKSVRGVPPSHRFAILGSPVKCDMRDAVKAYIEGRKKGGPPQVRFVVRGHYKSQRCGKGGLDRKTIWVQPYWKGEGDVVLVRTQRVYDSGLDSDESKTEGHGHSED